MSSFVEQWYVELELWYNHTDRYINVMDVWRLAFQMDILEYQ